jgi:hypothetical protein
LAAASLSRNFMMALCEGRHRSLRHDRAPSVAQILDAADHVP